MHRARVAPSVLACVASVACAACLSGGDGGERPLVRTSAPAIDASSAPAPAREERMAPPPVASAPRPDAGPAAMATIESAPPRACPPALAARANEVTEAWRKKHAVPGVAVAIASDGASCVVTSGLRGPGLAPVTPDTAFSMGSVQKVFHATLLAYVIEQGKARLDDPAARHLVAENGGTIPPEAPFGRATLRNLVTHTASLVKDDSDDADADPRGLGKDTAVEDERNGANLYRDKAMPTSLLAQLVALRPPYPFGTRYAYSNDGFVVAGYAATSIAKTSYTALLREVVVEPLGLQRTGAAVCDAPNDFCASGHNAARKPSGRSPVGLWTTGGDMAKFLNANLGELPLPEVQTRAFRRAHAPSFDRGAGRAVAMGWEISTRGPTELHAKNGAGAGFSSWVGIEPQGRRGVAVLTNVQHRGEASPAALGRALLDAMRAASPKP